MPIAVGALVILTLGAIALAILAARYHGSIPLLPAVLAALLCSLIGGYLATRLAQVGELGIGVLSGLIAGLVAQAMLFAKEVTTPLTGVLVMCIFVGSGAVGGWLTQVRLSVEKLAQAKPGQWERNC